MNTKLYAPGFDPQAYHLDQARPLNIKSSKDIHGSRIGIGFETLDRFMFDPERVYPTLAKLGAKWARVQTGWCRCEPEIGQYDFQWLDEIVDRLLAIGIQPWFNLGFGNRVHMPDAPHPSGVGCVPLYYGDAAQKAWVVFVQKAAEHYRDRVTHWEIWNEPNTPNFWHPVKPGVDQYIQLVKLTAPVIRQAISKARILGGATAGFCPTLFQQYMEQGLGQWIDGYTFHPYRMIPEWHYRQEVAFHRAIAKQHAPGLELWQGENGCPAVAENHNDEWLGIYAMNETIHAKWVVRRVLSDLASGLDFSSYFHAVDLMGRDYVQADGTKRKPVMMGLIRGEDYQPRQSFHAMSVLCSLLDDRSQLTDRFLAKVSKPACRPTTCDKIPYIAAETSHWLREDQPLFAYQYPEDTQQKSSPMTTAIWFHLMDADRLNDPVLVDPLSQQAYPICGTKREQDGRVILIENLPLVDYPLFITDRSVLP